MFNFIKTLGQTLLIPDGRRAWALFFLVLGAGIMTGYALYALYLVRFRATYVFYLGLAAHFHIFVVLTALAGLLVKRVMEAQFGENKKLLVQDKDDPAVAATQVASAAVDEAVRIIEEKKP